MDAISTQRHESAWLFLHPDYDAFGPHTGLQLSPARQIAVVEGNLAIRQAIRLLISTRPGERVMRPTYGCDLYRLIFAPNDDTTAGLAIHYIRKALEHWEPRIEILQLDANRNPNNATLLDILLDYRVRANQQNESLRLSMQLNGVNTGSQSMTSNREKERANDDQITQTG